MNSMWVRRIPQSVEEEDALNTVLEWDGVIGTSLELGGDDQGEIVGDFCPALRENEVYRYLWDEAGKLHGSLDVTYKDFERDESYSFQMRVWIEDNHTRICVGDGKSHRIGWELANVKDETVLAGPKIGYLPDMPKFMKFPG